MIIPDEVDENPSNEQVEHLQSVVFSVHENVMHYRDCAGQIDDDFRNANEHLRIGLDDLPYGEEMVRTQNLPAQLVKAARLLELESVTASAFNEARETVVTATETLDDCTPLPPSMREPE
ncbi:hypothetical protein [Burkholderia seminalis]|uniref:hypothetical protein n=1 Tax=Burkholderia seminalis TaxID=488731 RepID=UPI00084F4A1E|nr:hypothetical protein [Burkholderia seminalis]